MKKLSFIVYLIAALILSTLPTGTASAASNNILLSPLDIQINTILDTLQKAEYAGGKKTEQVITTGKGVSLANLVIQYPNGYRITNKEEFRLFILDVSTPDVGAKVKFLGKTKDVDAKDVNKNFASYNLGDKNEKYVYEIQHSVIRKWNSSTILIKAIQIGKEKPVNAKPTKFSVNTVPEGYVFEGVTGIRNIKSFVVSSNSNLIKSKLVYVSNQKGVNEPIVRRSSEINTYLSESRDQDKKFKVRYIKNEKSKVVEEVIFTDLSVTPKNPLIGKWNVQFDKGKLQELDIKTYTVGSNGIGFVTGTFKGTNGVFAVNGTVGEKTSSSSNNVNVRLKLTYVNKDSIEKDLIQFLTHHKKTHLIPQIKADNLAAKLLIVSGDIRNGKNKSSQFYKEMSFIYKSGKKGVRGEGGDWATSTSMKKMTEDSFQRPNKQLTYVITKQ